MAEARRHGTWSKVHESIDTHPKTAAAAAVLVAELGLDPDHAAAVVTRAVRRLVCWALREQDLGRTGDLGDFAFVGQAWPAAIAPGGALWGRTDVSVLRRALRAVPEGHEHGFLFLHGRRQGSPGVEFIHEFAFHAWEALKGRATYRGCSVEDFTGSPYGRRGAPAPRPAAPPPARPDAQGLLPLVPELGPAQGPSSPSAAPPRAHPSDPLDAGGPSAGQAPVATPPGLSTGSPPAPAAPARRSDEVIARLRRGSPEVGGEVAAGFRRNPLAPQGRPSPDRHAGPVLSIHPSAAEDQNGTIQAAAPALVPSGPGWLGVPEGVRRGDPAAVAEWLRRLGAMSQAGLYAGATYVARFTEHAGIVPPGAASDPTCPPGRALEALAPLAFQALVDDLTGHLPSKDFPRKYTARALSGRWEEVLSRTADEAQARRDRWRAEGRA